MTPEYISREAAINEVEFGITYAMVIDVETGERKRLFEDSNEELQKAIERLKKLPPADVRPVVHGYWKPDGMSNVLRCSVCNTPYLHSQNFCCVCGADMREEVKP